MKGWVLCLVFALCASTVWAREGKTHVLDTSDAGMKAISQALGVDCTYCHQAKKADGKPDYEAPSPMNETAIYMQRHYVDALVTAQGDSLTCQTCHQGKARFVPRDTSEAKPSQLAGMPRTEIVDMMKGMVRGIGAEGCDYCHVRRRDGRLNPETPTPHKVAARYMIDHFSGHLLVKNTGKRATCETCHRGHTRFLPHRSD